MVLASFPVVGHGLNQSGPGIVRPGRDLSTSRQNLLATYSQLIYHTNLRMQGPIFGLAGGFERSPDSLYVRHGAHCFEVTQRLGQKGLGSIRFGPSRGQRGQFRPCPTDLPASLESFEELQSRIQTGFRFGVFPRQSMRNAPGPLGNRQIRAVPIPQGQFLEERRVPT